MRRRAGPSRDRERVIASARSPAGTYARAPATPGHARPPLRWPRDHQV